VYGARRSEGDTAAMGEISASRKTARGNSALGGPPANCVASPQHDADGVVAAYLGDLCGEYQLADTVSQSFPPLRRCVEFAEAFAGSAHRPDALHFGFIWRGHPVIPGVSCPAIVVVCIVNIGCCATVVVVEPRGGDPH
jgi:hypothetical protein